MQTSNRWQTLAIIVTIICVRQAAGMELQLAEELALDNDPALVALERRVEARTASAHADGALPDPELTIGAQGVPVDDPIGADMMTQYRIGVRQRFPAGDTRELRTREGEREADALRARLEKRRLEVLRDTRTAWLDWATARQGLVLARTSRKAFEDLLDNTQARYRAGTGRQRDISQAKLELALLDQRIIARQTAVDEAASRLERWTGLTPADGFEPELPEWPAPRPADVLAESLRTHPAISALKHREAAGEVRVGLAREAYGPQWMIEAGYGHTRGNNPVTMQRMSDKVFAMVSFSLPLFTADRQDRRLAAARSELQARGHDIEDRLRALRGALDRQWRLWQRHDERLAQLEQHVLVEAENTVESTLAAYRSDRATFDELVRARLALLEQELAAIDLRRERGRAAIELAYLAEGFSQ